MKLDDLLYAGTCRLSELLKCKVCGNDFIEIFGKDPKWWVGCKPCSKRDIGIDHLTAKTRIDAVHKWNELNNDEE